jgi:Spy/CpxP family protein refolding chaperone
MRALLLATSLLAFGLAAAQTGFGMKGRLMIVMMPDAKKELKITREQDKQIQEAIKKADAEIRAGGLPAGMNMMDMMNPMAMMDPILVPILDDVQKIRLEELFLQVNGGHALTDATVAAAMELDDDQKAQIKAIKAEASQDLLSRMSGLRSQSAANELKKKQKEFGDKMLAVLRPEQAAKFETAKGKPFKFKN